MQLTSPMQPRASPRQPSGLFLLVDLEHRFSGLRSCEPGRDAFLLSGAGFYGSPARAALDLQSQNFSTELVKLVKYNPQLNRHTDILSSEQPRSYFHRC